MKKHNPNTPILIREAQGVEPRVWARYGIVTHAIAELKTDEDQDLEGK